MLFKNLIYGAFLLFTLASILATSYGTTGAGRMVLQSDCVQPPANLVIDVSNYQITSPSGASYSDFGFPADVVRLDTPVQGTVGSANRVCTKSYGNEQDGNIWVFVCEDDGQYACTITLHQPE